MYEWYNFTMIKKISTLLMIVIFAAGSFLVTPQKTYAQVTDPVVAPIKIVEAIIQNVLEPLLASVSQRLINKLTTDTLNWANGGFDGEPGFINNWDDFLQGTKHDLISAAFSSAETAASVAVLNVRQGNETNSYSNCVDEARDVYALNNQLGGVYTGGNDGLSLEEFISNRCDDTLNVVTENNTAYLSCSNSITTKKAFLQKIGQASKLENYTQAQCDNLLNQEINQTVRQNQYNECIQKAPNDYITGSNLDSQFTKYAEDTCKYAYAGTIGNNLSATAAENYEVFKNINVTDTRQTARSVLNIGLENLFGGNKVDNIINGQGETLSLHLENASITKEELNTNLATWPLYMALGDPYNTESGKESLINEKLSGQLFDTISNTIQEQVTPKFLDKTECDGLKDANGKCLGKETAVTIADHVEQAASSAFTQDIKDINSLQGMLVQTLVKGIGDLTQGLLQQGTSKISEKASESFFNNSDANNLITASNEFGQDYQSEYDVLGIKSDGNYIEEFAEETGTGTGSLLEQAKEKSLIGGPEDESSSDFGRSSKIIVNLKENLESALFYTEKERDYYNGIDAIIIGSQDSAQSLDQCNPGPDYGWQERYENKLKSHKDNKKQTKNLIGLPETETMASDPQINIPGSFQMTELFRRIVDGEFINNAEMEERRKMVRENYVVLGSIKSMVRKQVNEHKITTENDYLILFTDDWNEFTTSEKILAYQTALDKGYAVLPGAGTVTSATDVVNTNQEKARESVINMGWEVWRKYTPVEKKQDARYPFYLIDSELSNQNFVEVAKVKETQIANTAIELEEILSDCLTIRGYTLYGLDEIQYPNKIATSSQAEKFERANEQLKIYLDINRNKAQFFMPGTQLLSLFQSLAGKNKATYINIDRARSDEDIKAFLEEQKRLQDSGGRSYFLTDYMTSDEAIENSILGFLGRETIDVEICEDEVEEVEEVCEEGDETCEEEEVEVTECENTGSQTLSSKEAYLSELYPYDDYDDKQHIQAPDSMTEIFYQDRVVFGTKATARISGILFCRNENGLDSCTKNWYTARDIDYKILFSGINR